MSLSFWGLLFICLEVLLYFPQPPHLQQGSSAAGREKSKSLRCVVRFRASVHLGHECNLPFESALDNRVKILSWVSWLQESMLNPYLNNRPTQCLVSGGTVFITNYQQPWLGKKLFCKWQTTQCLGRRGPALASPISFHGEACFVS